MNRRAMLALLPVPFLGRLLAPLVSQSQAISHVNPPQFGGSIKITDLLERIGAPPAECRIARVVERYFDRPDIHAVIVDLRDEDILGGGQ